MGLREVVSRAPDRRCSRVVAAVQAETAVPGKRAGMRSRASVRDCGPGQACGNVVPGKRAGMSPYHERSCSARGGLTPFWLPRFFAVAVLGALRSPAGGFGLLQAPAAECGAWTPWTPPPPRNTDPQPSSNRVALRHAPRQSKPTKLQVLNADVGMGQQVCLMMRSLEELLRNGAGFQQTANTARRTAAHGKSMVERATLAAGVFGPRSHRLSNARFQG